MPAESKLLMGTFLLEDTDQAVTPEQASQLLLLWKGVKSLSSSDNVTQSELDALYTQIKETMTAEQMAAIDGMTIDAQTLRALMEKLGVGVANGSGNGTDSSGSEFGFFFGDGQLPPGDFQGEPPQGGGAGRPSGGEGGVIINGGGPGGGGQIPGGGLGGQGTQLTEEQRATLQAQRSQNGGRRSFGMNLLLIDPLIQLLEERAAQ